MCSIKWMVAVLIYQSWSISCFVIIVENVVTWLDLNLSEQQLNCHLSIPAFSLVFFYLLFWRKAHKITLILVNTFGHSHRVQRLRYIDPGETREAGPHSKLHPVHLKSLLPASGGTLSLFCHRHGDVAGHLHLLGLFRRLLVGLGRHRHAVLLLQLPAAQAEAPPGGEAEGTVSANRRDGATQLSPYRIPFCASATSTTPTTSTAAPGGTAVLPPTNQVSACSSSGSSSDATSKLGQHAR